MPVSQEDRATGWDVIRGELGPLRIAGLAVLQLLVVDRLVDMPAKHEQLFQYTLLGTIFPVVFLTLGLTRLSGWIALPLRTLNLGLTLLAVAACAAAVMQPLNPVVAGTAAVQWVGASIWIAWGRHRDAEPSPWGTRLAVACVWLFGLLLTLTCWTAASKFVWWTPFPTYVLAHRYNTAVFAAAFLLTSVCVFRSQSVDDGPEPILGWLVDALALSLFALASLRLDTLGAPMPGNPYPGIFVFTHWGALIGPAELVRQGGWLYWDVPSQYGFLSTLTIAFLPVRSIWQSLYIVQASMTFASGVILYGIARTIEARLVGRAFWMCVVLAAVFIVPGLTYDLTGPSVHPPLGAFRYLWLYALLGVLVWWYSQGCAETDGPRWLACLVWLVGCLWSSESLVGCSAVFVPGYLAMIASRAMKSNGWRRLGVASAWLALPVVMLAASVGIVAAYYHVRLGHYPDWPAYTEYGQSITVGKMAENFDRKPIVLTGAFGVLFWVFCLPPVVGADLIQRRRGLAAIGLLGGAFGALWASSSYFALRGADFVVDCVAPMMVASAMIVLLVLAREWPERRLAGLIRMGLVPMLTVVIAMGLGNRERTPDWLNAMKRGYVRKVDKLLPVMEPELVKLLDEAGVKPGDPVSFLDDGFYWLKPIPARPVASTPGERAHVRWDNPTWLPTMPYLNFVFLWERGQVYIDRYVERQPRSGWLVRTKNLPPRFTQTMPWLFDKLTDSHVERESFEGSRWKVTRYEVRPEVAARRVETGTVRR